MADERQNEQEKRLSVEDMPAEVQKLADTMLGVNPAWDVQNWLVEQATLAMDLLEIDLNREKLMIEQRVRRLEDLGRRLESNHQPLTNQDPHQQNLFDCFDLNEEHPLRGLGERALHKDSQKGEEQLEHHASNVFLDLMPNDNSDDPLLAITCQAMLMVVDGELAKGEPVATLESIFSGVQHLGIEDREFDEALDHLLSTGVLLEIDDDCFIPLPV